MKRLGIALAALLFAGEAAAQNFYSAPYLANGLTTTVKTAKAAPGALTWWQCVNPNNAVSYVQVFDVASATTVTLGTTVPKAVLPLAANQSFGTTLALNFLLGIKLAATTTATGNTAPGVALDCTFGVR